MPTINKLSRVDVIKAGTLFPVYDQDAGDARAAAASVLLAYIQANLGIQDNKITQYAAPSATGFSVQIRDSNSSIWLLLTPTAGYAAGTLVLPQLANCADKQEILVNCTQAVTTLTINGNGATVTGAPTTLAANAFFTLRFDAVTSAWYRV
jgi:hypothetical protein